MEPSKSFQQSHLAGDAERERNSIARRTTGWMILILGALVGLCLIIYVLNIEIADRQCNTACIATGIRGAGFSKPDPNKFMGRYCVCEEHLLLERVQEERARRLKD